MLNLPNEPIILLSFINTKLRDFYSSLDDFCNDTQCDKQEIIDKLNSINYQYNKKLNKFM